MAEPNAPGHFPRPWMGTPGPPRELGRNEDYLRLPEDGNRYEVIRGFLYVTAAPYPLHEYVRSELFLVPGNFVKARKLGKVLSALMDVRLPQRIGDPVQPDLFFLRTGNQPRWKSDSSFDGVPDLAIEVLYRRTAHRDRKIKLEAYREAGIQEYWIVDTWKPSVVVYLLSEDRRRYRVQPVTLV